MNKVLNLFKWKILYYISSYFLSDKVQELIISNSIIFCFFGIKLTKWMNN